MALALGVLACAFVFAPRMTAPSLVQTPITMAEQLPGSPKDIATEMSLAVSAALTDGKRRLDVTLPDGLCFGLFGSPPGAQTLGIPGSIDKLTKQRADRELAFLFCEMFQNMGNGATAVAFRDQETALVADREWSKSNLAALPRIVTSVSELAPRTKRSKSGSGFGAGGGGANLGGSAGAAPPKIVLLVRPGKSQIRELEPIVEPLGDEVVVVLLNAARLKSGGSRRGFEPTYTLLSNPHPGWRGGILYRPYPDQWHLGVAAKAGGPRIHGRSAARPTLDEIDVGLSKVKDDTSLVTGGALAAVGAAAALERVGELPMSFAGEVAAEASKAAVKEEEPQEILPGADKIRSFFGIDN